MIKIAGINKNDVVNGEGISVSLFLQGCPFHCRGCHNPESWDPKGGIAADEKELIEEIKQAIRANGIIRNLSILGGEPFDTIQKREFLFQLFREIKNLNPKIKIFAWTGYTFEQLKQEYYMPKILDYIDYLIDGPFDINKRDVTLKWRGSSNQRIINMKEGTL
jgi:anaerobic ribonucleoside-triphosphate reductase activating protein